MIEKKERKGQEFVFLCLPFQRSIVPDAAEVIPKLQTRVMPSPPKEKKTPNRSHSDIGARGIVGLSNCTGV